MNKVHFSSKASEWETPDDLFWNLSQEMGPFDLDVCADAANAKCSRYFSKADDGLSRTWERLDGGQSRAWMNPPYGREIGAWIRKAHEEAQAGRAVTVALLPARTDTRWFHEDIVEHRYSFSFLRGRVTFVGAKHPAPFPSMVVIFAPTEQQ